MSDATINAGGANATPAAPTGLVAHIEKLFAETGDAALHGLRVLAGEVEKIAHGGVEPAAIEAVIADKVKAVVEPFLEQLRQVFEQRLGDLEGQLAKLAAAGSQVTAAAQTLSQQVQGQPASPAPAQLPNDGSAPAPAAPAAAPAQPVAPGAP